MEKIFKISVIVPAYNAENYLNRALDSIRSQTIFDEMQIIIVDDGSTDKTGMIADEFAGQNKNAVCIHQKNGGESAARNTGLEMAKGEYIGFVDADDWVEPKYYENLYGAAVSTRADIAACGFVMESRNRELVSNPLVHAMKQLSRDEGVKAFLRREIDVHACTKVFRHECIKRIRFCTEITIGEDRWFSFDSIMNAQKIVLVPGCGYHYCMNADSLTNTMDIDRDLDNLKFGAYMTEQIKTNFPAFQESAESMDIMIKCRLLGDLTVMDHGMEYHKLYTELKKEIRRFPIRKAYGNLGKKHFMSLLIAKASPRLYARLRSNPCLRFKA